jgi:hypothetical protein
LQVFVKRAFAVPNVVGSEALGNTNASPQPWDLATFLARRVSEISGEPWSIPTNDHKARSTTRSALVTKVFDLYLVNTREEERNLAQLL